MALKLTRNAGSVVYGGWNLNPHDLEQSYDHRLWVRSVRDGDLFSAVVHLTDSAGSVSEHALCNDGKHLELDDDITVSLESVRNYVIRETPYCRECDRGGELQKIIPQASFAFSAPRDYQIIRDDARKKT